MLGWRKGLGWKVRYRSITPSMAAVGPEAVTDEVQEYTVAYEVTLEDSKHWVLEADCGEGYEVWFHKSPLSVYKVLSYYTTRPEGKVLWDEVMKADVPGDHLYPFLAGRLPLIIDFPALTFPHEGDEPVNMTLDGDRVRTEFVFEKGMPFWTRARRFVGDKADIEAELER